MKPRRNLLKSKAASGLIDRLPILNDKTIATFQLVVYSVAFVAIAAVWLSPRLSSDRTDVTATSEARLRQISVGYLPGDMLPKWELIEGQIVDADENPAGAYCKDGSFSFSTQHHGEVEANMIVGFNGAKKKPAPMIATIQYLTPSAIGMLGSFDCSADRPLPPQFDLVLSLGSDPTAQWASAFSGRFVMGDASPIAMSGGDDFHRAPTGIIDSGQLTTEVRTFPVRSATIRTTTPLYAGDSVSFVASSKNDASIRPVSHIIAQRDGEEIKIVSRTRAKQIQVKRLGETDVPSTDLAPPLWARFRAQEEWLLLLAAFWGTYVTYATTGVRRGRGD
jgi:hypothetical protein